MNHHHRIIRELLEEIRRLRNERDAADDFYDAELHRVEARNRRQAAELRELDEVLDDLRRLKRYQ